MKTFLSSRALKRIKKIGAVLIASSMVFSIASCSEKSDEKDKDIEETTKREETTKETLETTSEPAVTTYNTNHIPSALPYGMIGLFDATGTLDENQTKFYFDDKIDGFFVVSDFETNTNLTYYNLTYNATMEVRVCSLDNGSYNTINLCFSIISPDSSIVNYFFNSVEADEIDDILENIDNRDFPVYDGSTIGSGLIQEEGFIEPQDVKYDAATILSRFVFLGEKALNDIGHSWDDFGFDFGTNYESVDPARMLKCDFRNNIELHHFENNTCTDGNLSSYSYLSSAIREMAIFQGQSPNEYGFSFVAPRSESMVYPSDAMTYEYYLFEDYVAINYDSLAILEDDFRCQLMLFPNTDEITIMFAISGELVPTDEPGTYSGLNDTWFFMTCDRTELGTICSSVESLMEASTLQMNAEGNYGNYSHEEVCEIFLEYYDNFMASYDNAFNYFGVSMEDFNIIY